MHNQRVGVRNRIEKPPPSLKPPPCSVLTFHSLNFTGQLKMVGDWQRNPSSEHPDFAKDKLSLNRNDLSASINLDRSGFDRRGMILGPSLRQWNLQGRDSLAFSATGKKSVNHKPRKSVVKARRRSSVQILFF